MKIAVTFENNEVFQHFGKTQTFKVYEVEEGNVISSEMLDANGTGHEALAGFLADHGVNLVICGGLGEGAKNALKEAKIGVCSGACGNADEVVEAFLNGEIIDQGVNCDHHEHEQEAEAVSGCGGSCGSCGGCGGGMPEPLFDGKNVGKNCAVHYKGTFNDGTVFDSSYDRGEPLSFICGIGMMIFGFDKAVADMEVGDVVDVHLMPEEAYGMPNPNAIFELEIANLPGSEDLEVGQMVYMSNAMGQQFPVKVTAKDDVMITLDANHEMAGKELNFTIELVSVE